MRNIKGGINVIDIGSSEIIVSVGRTTDSGVEILGLGKSRSAGIRNGMITDIEDSSNAILHAVKEAENITGIAIRSAAVAIKGKFLSCTNSSGGVGISSPDQEIAIDDVVRAIEASKKIGVPYGYEMIHILPRSFSVDGYTGIKNPVGMSGVRLDAESHINIGLSSVLKNINKVLEKSRVANLGFINQIIAEGYFGLNESQKDLGALMLDIGRDGISYTIFESGEVLLTGYSGLGAGKITNDISVALKVNIFIAEEIKKKYGDCFADEDTGGEFNLNEFDPEEDRMISRKFLAQVISSRVRDMFESVFGSISRFHPDVEFHAGVVISGGGGNLRGIARLARKFFGLSCQVASPLDIVSSMPNSYDPKHLGSTAPLHWMLDDNAPTDFATTDTRSLKSRGQSRGFIDWLKSLLP
jgi:cell division protein FtsA